MDNHKRRQFIASGFFVGFASWLYPSRTVAEEQTTPHEIEELSIQSCHKKTKILT